MGAGTEEAETVGAGTMVVEREYAGPDECDLLPEQFILCSEGFTLL